MKFILLITYLSGQPYGGSHGISMQEFESKSSCEFAGERAKKLVESVHKGEGREVVYECVQK